MFLGVNRRHVRSLCCFLLTVWVSACSTTQPWRNEPLEAQEPVRYDGLAQLTDTSRNPDLLVVASFSGGGSRAAAFAHAVVSELRSDAFVWRDKATSLASEIDVVAGVSGGSVAAAHLALHGVDESLRRFPSEFLAIDFQSRVVRSILSPRNLVRTTSPWFGRGQVLAEAFDEHLFRGATFGSLNELPGRPYLLIGATDLSTGADFDFTSDQLGRLCSSIDRVPLAFAVAASSSVPLLFSPLTLQSHNPVCAARGEATADRPEVAGDSARVRLVKQEMNALGLSQRNFVHLVDGGLADNLGTRRITDYVAQAGGMGPVMKMLGLTDPAGGTMTRRIVFISVNSERHLSLDMDRNGEVPSPLAVLNAMVYSGLGRFSRETSLIFSDAVAQWRREIQASTTLGSDADVYSIELKLADIDDPELRKTVLDIPTSFRIEDKHLHALRQAAKAALASSAEYQRFRLSVRPASGPVSPRSDRVDAR